MTRTERHDLLFVLAFFVGALFLLPPVFWGESTLCQRFLTAGVVLRAASLGKLFFVAFGAVYAWRNLRCLAADNPVRPAWLLLAAGLSAYLLGQAALSYYQVLLSVATPFPSIADLFFVLALLLLIPALVVFIHAYRKSGFPFDSKVDLALMGGGSTVVLIVLGIVFLGPVVRPREDFGLGELLEIVYPVSDIFLLVPALILFKITWRLRGGQVGKMWLALLVGLFAMAGGDITFAYLTDSATPLLDAVVDLMFLAAYISIARGVLFQYELLR